MFQHCIEQDQRSANRRQGSGSYSSELGIAQEANQGNNCNESGDGRSNAGCTNTASNRVGNIIYVNQGSGTFSNTADINQGINQENNCNESGDGSSNARCTNTASNRVGPIIYVNQGSGTLSNSADINQQIDQENNCNESGDGRALQDVQTRHPIELDL